MLIKCPKCSVRYEIPDEIGLSEGRKLKCSNCNHVFLCPAQSEQVMPVETSNPVEQSEIEENEPILSSPEMEKPIEMPVFLNENTSCTENVDAVAETFAPVETDVKRHEYHPSCFVVIATVLALGILGGLGFYYSDYLSTDYLLGMNEHAGRTKVSRTSIKKETATIANEVDQKGISHGESPKDISDDQEPVTAVLKNMIVLPDDETQTAPLDQVEEAVVEEIDIPEIANTENTNVPNVKMPVVQSVYFDTEKVQENTNQKRVQIRGTLLNSSDADVILPPVVHAVAFDNNGQEIFKKDIFLSFRILRAGESQDFFGSYIWTPATDSVQIQWIDVSL